MAVVDKYADVNTEAGKLSSAISSQGVQTITLVSTISVAAADDNGSVYRAFPAVPSSLVPVNICIHNTAMTAATDYDVGLYKVNGGAVVDKDKLADGLDINAGTAISGWNNLGMTTISIASGLLDLAALGAETNPDPAYDICLTANTVGTDAGTIRVTATFAYV